MDKRKNQYKIGDRLRFYYDYSYSEWKELLPESKIADVRVLQGDSPVFEVVIFGKKRIKPFTVDWVDDTIDKH